MYRNVLGRAGDAGGRAYWIGKLNRGASRGQVMVNFSESAEYVRTTKTQVDVIGAFTSLLHRAPTKAEVSEWKVRDLRVLFTWILDSDAYADRHR